MHSLFTCGWCFASIVVRPIPTTPVVMMFSASLLRCLLPHNLIKCAQDKKLSQEEISRLSHEVQAFTEGLGAVRFQQQELQEVLVRRIMENAERDGGVSTKACSSLSPS